jgi:hypothetical protein
MSISRKLRRESNNSLQKELKKQTSIDNKRWIQALEINKVETCQLYQRYWNEQPVLARRCTLKVIECHDSIGTSYPEPGTWVSAIEIATFSQWLDNKYFYVLLEKVSEKEHDLWYMMQFKGYAPMAMKTVKYCKPVAGSIEYPDLLPDIIIPESIVNP